MIYVQTCCDSREDGHKTIITVCDCAESYVHQKRLQEIKAD